MGILRSEPMRHGTLVLPVDRARHLIDTIGSSAKMQFEDMNARELHRPYKKYIQRIDEMERIIRFLTEELAKVPGAEIAPGSIDEFLIYSERYKLDDVEASLKQTHQDFIQFKENSAGIVARRNAALEERYVIQTAITSMSQTPGAFRPNTANVKQDVDQFAFAASRSLLDDEGGTSATRILETMFSNVAGVIPQVDQDRFARALFRATRGNTFTHFQQIAERLKDPKTDLEVHKSVFVVYFQDTTRPGTSVSAMSEKIAKICSSFGVNTYRWPTGLEAAEEMRLALSIQAEDQQRLLRAHESFVRSEAASLLEPVRHRGNSVIEEWRMFCAKEKSIYATLNLFEGHMNLRASCWYPAADEEEIRRLLIQQSAGHGHSSAMLVADRTLPTKQPPTYIRRNEFTAVFQDLVDTYGKPRYGEANPALFAVVTFPFLFGVMFGDIGHGSMLLLIGVYAIRRSDDLRLKMPDLYAARYIVFMMGFFSVYAGLLYNDIFSVGLNLFGSRWLDPGIGPGHSSEVRDFKPLYDVKNQGGPGPYPFGVDPAWHGAQNELVFMNSLKMKMSVVIGVVQMIVGLLLRIANALHERNITDLVCECIPMMIFMLCFFGFMDYMILYKWVTPLVEPPSIINSMIAMAMWTEDSNPMLGAELPRLLMAVTMLTVPIMLIPKPIVLFIQHRAKMRELERATGRKGAAAHPSCVLPLQDEESVGGMDDFGCDDVEPWDFGEVVIHQIIETIEYVLGTVSHTASYLRLWALSLAHQQLSVVFFGMTLVSAMGSPFPLNVITIYLAFAVWFAITLAILLGMDTMECFLHTLRLHWVEFQSKFYRGDGYLFTPFRHKDILAHRGDD